jgi:hypothetical protein
MGQRVVLPILRRTTITATASCRTELFDMARAQRVSDIPADAAEDNIFGKMGPLETHHHHSPPSLLTEITEEEHSPNRLK